MPIKQNAYKALRQSKKRALANKKVKIAYKMAVKNTMKAIEQKADKAQILEAAQAAQKTLDKAAQKGVLKPNTAARKLSRLMKRIHATDSK